jgi:hypothetical protein
MAGIYSLPDFDEDDAPDIEAHLADPSATAAEGDDADDDVEAHGQSSFR